LTVEVNLLKRELRALREELQTLRAEEPDPSVTVPQSDQSADRQKADPSSAMTVEEAA
jgi:hypothetical protein